MKGGSILVIDDDRLICNLLREWLQAAGYRVTTQTDVEAALQLLGERPFDLVITDFTMPAMSGVDVVERSKRLHPAMPVCLMSGILTDVTPTDLPKFAAALEKPFPETVLLTTVERLLATSTPVSSQRVSRPPRFEVDWRVDCIPLTGAALAAGRVEARPARLLNLSERGLAFGIDELDPNDKVCAFLLYPPGRERPVMLVGEVRWREDSGFVKSVGTELFSWASEPEKSETLAAAR